MVYDCYFMRNIAVSRHQYIQSGLPGSITCLLAVHTRKIRYCHGFCFRRLSQIQQHLRATGDLFTGSRYLSGVMSARGTVSANGLSVKTYGSFEVKCKFGHEINGTIHVLVVEDK